MSKTHMGDDVLVEILSRLPKRSLPRFRYVCKSWWDLISRMNELNSLCFLWLADPRGPLCIDYNEILFHKDGDGPLAIRKPRLELRKSISLLQIVGSCNGLVCLHERTTQFLIWNPCTGGLNKLPELRSFSFRRLFYGFGYDSTTQDYKIMLLVLTGKLTTELAIFSLKSSSWSWTTVEGLDFFHSVEEGRACLLNEALHWLELHEDGKGSLVGSKSRIISFDLAKEKFLELVPLSNLIMSAEYHGVKSGGIGTSRNFLFLYFVECYFIANAITIWGMKEYGVKESWTKLVQIPKVSLPQNLFRKPVCVLENGVVLFTSYTRDLVLYDPEEKAWRTVCSLSNYRAHDTVTFAESLVSPNTGR